MDKRGDKSYNAQRTYRMETMETMEKWSILSLVFDPSISRLNFMSRYKLMSDINRGEFSNRTDN